MNRHLPITGTLTWKLKQQLAAFPPITHDSTWIHQHQRHKLQDCGASKAWFLCLKFYGIWYTYIRDRNQLGHDSLTKSYVSTVLLLTGLWGAAALRLVETSALLFKESLVPRRRSLEGRVFCWTMGRSTVDCLTVFVTLVLGATLLASEIFLAGGIVSVRSVVFLIEGYLRWECLDAQELNPRRRDCSMV